MKPKKKIVGHILNVVIIALIVEVFLCMILLVRQYARKDCFTRIEETTTQMSEMMNHALTENHNKLTVFAGILATNSSNPDELLRTYMENFTMTQNFSAVCIHRKDGSVVSYGDHPHEAVVLPGFDAEVERLPYVSEVYTMGKSPAERCFYQAVPIIRNGETVGILYGYTTLDELPDFISSTAYDGACEFYVVDGDTGDFLMDEYHDELNNIYDDSLGSREVREGYSLEEMRHKIRNRESGYFIFRAQRTEEWYYVYYMPLGINDWSIQLTIKEKTAFASYDEMTTAVVGVAGVVVALMMIHVLLLMLDSNRNRRWDQEMLRKSRYVNEIQSDLMNAHNNPENIDRALKKIAQEMQAETALLLTFTKQTVANAYYWPSKDKQQVSSFMDRNVQDDFPVLYDVMSEGHSAYYDAADPALKLSEQARAILMQAEVSNLLIAPILDKNGSLKGAISVANMEKPPKSAEMLECITYDLFMAIMNVENHDFIKRMGMIDFLTGVKNRNSYESELHQLTGQPGENLWCVFIDAIGLHEINNTRGHKAGDLMLCAVADLVKKRFGTKLTYRVGGDEFVAFATDSTHEEFLRRKHAILEELNAMGYNASVGFAGVERAVNGEFDVERLVEEAESLMYQDKMAYYKAHNIPWERGHFPASVQK